MNIIVYNCINTTIIEYFYYNYAFLNIQYFFEKAGIFIEFCWFLQTRALFHAPFFS